MKRNFNFAGDLVDFAVERGTLILLWEQFFFLLLVNFGLSLKPMTGGDISSAPASYVLINILNKAVEEVKMFKFNF